MYTITQRDIDLLAVCTNIASNSPDPMTKVGCVIYADGAPYVQGGFNRFPKDLPITIDRLQRPEKYKRMMHAEHIAIIQALTTHFNLEGATLYSTQIPCPQCALVIIEVGIKRVVSVPFPPESLTKWSDDLGLVTEMFGESDVELAIHEQKEN